MEDDDMDITIKKGKKVVNNKVKFYENKTMV